MNRLTWELTALLLAATAASVVCVVFETPFAEASIDWLSFFAGAFLITEGFYKILKYRKDPSSLQLCRFIRIFIGVNVFLVHLAEFIGGPHAPAEASALLGTIIDWAAFSFGIFLMIEGTIGLVTPGRKTQLIAAKVSGIGCRVSGAKKSSELNTQYSILNTSYGNYLSDQIMRAMRIVIGSSVFTIHLLQFMR